ncbi:MAG: tRNA lysidine(34) synthetase TilS [Flavobacteriaceae bacterium]|nr:tRNA lysidine(34) synthetase TilS [Flavobacteriaceae bacterium]
MQGKKKVSKFLKDEKISLWEKEKIWLLCDADDHILGVLPLRQDRRFFNFEGKDNIFLF